MINSKELFEYTKELSILFVEDHTELRVNTTEILKNFFKKVDSAENGIDALLLYKKELQSGKSYDIILTDIQMPKMDGVILTEEIYTLNPSQIVIVLSAHDETKYLLPLINLGIEQFIKKPIDYQELLKVLLNISKKLSLNVGTSHINNNNIDIQLHNNFLYSRDKNLLFNNEESVYLTKYEIIFIQLLTEQIGKVYSNEDIVEVYASQNETIDAQNIRKLVSKLRKKLPDNSLESIYGVGYRFTPYFE